MKFPRLLMLMALLLGTLSVLILPGCHAGANARENILAPALSLTSHGFESDVAAGVATVPISERAAAQDVADMYFEAVRSKDIDRITTEARPLWPTVRGYAELGIRQKLADGLIGPLGVESKAERIHNIGEALDKTTGSFGW